MWNRTSSRGAIKTSTLSALYHPLTGLAGEFLLLDRLAQAMPNARRQGEYISLLLVDFDSFRSVCTASTNDFEQTLLCTIGKRLELSVRESDTVTHFGGDRFAVGLFGLKQVAGADTVARKLCSILANPYELPDQSVRLTASIGVASFPQDANKAEGLLAAAARALRDAKARGGNRVSVEVSAASAKVEVSRGSSSSRA